MTRKTRKGARTGLRKSSRGLSKKDLPEPTSCFHAGGMASSSRPASLDSDASAFPNLRNVPHAPPPWSLEGEGFIFPLLANREYNLERGFLNERDRAEYRGGLGAVMLVNYFRSDVGPYYELLYIPGNFRSQADGKTYKRISRIVVSSEISVREGIRNWAIPKEVADFRWDKSENETRIEIMQNGQVFFAACIRNGRLPFPVTTALLPFALLQRAPEQWLRTRLSGSGTGRLARLEELRVDEARFPDPRKAGAGSRGIYVNPFRLKFPVPDAIADS